MIKQFIINEDVKEISIWEGEKSLIIKKNNKDIIKISSIIKYDLIIKRSKQVEPYQRKNCTINKFYIYSILCCMLVVYTKHKGDFVKNKKQLNMLMWIYCVESTYTTQSGRVIKIENIKKY